MVGSWEVNVSVGSMPQKVATACSKLNDLVGAEYTPIAYLGSQLVNGTNHAVLMEQLLITGKDTKNIVLVIFNEKPGSLDDLTLVSIERLIEGGSGMGGVTVDVKVKEEMDKEALEAFHSALGNFVGKTVVPFAQLASQVVKGINYVFAYEGAPVTLDAKKEVGLVTVNSLTGTVRFVNILDSALNVALGSPLGEWP